MALNAHERRRSGYLETDSPTQEITMARAKLHRMAASIGIEVEPAPDAA